MSRTYSASGTLDWKALGVLGEEKTVEADAEEYLAYLRWFVPVMRKWG
jgi:hypothetical protein